MYGCTVRIRFLLCNISVCAASARITSSLLIVSLIVSIPIDRLLFARDVPNDDRDIPTSIGFTEFAADINDSNPSREKPGSSEPIIPEG